MKIESNKGITPQLIQQKYNGYKQLILDIKGVNNILLSYKDELEKLIKGKK